MERLKILHLEDDKFDADFVKRELEKSSIQYELLWVTNEIDFKDKLNNYSPDVILSDHSLPSFTSIDALKIVKDSRKNLPFILVTGTVSESFAVSMMKRGVADYILKDQIHLLPKAILNARERWNSKDKRKEFRREVIHNVKKYKALAENISDAIVLVDENSVLKYQSPTVERITGFPLQDTMGKAILESIHPLDVAEVRGLFHKLLLNPSQSVHKAFRILHKKGHFIWVEGTISNLLHDESIKAFIINYRDITERKYSEELLKRSEANIKAIIENTDAQVYSIDKDYCYITFNNLFKENTKEFYSVEIKPGSKVFDFLKGKNKAEIENWRKIYEKAFTGESLRFVKEETVNNCKTYISFSINPIWKDDVVIGLSCFARDITQEKLAEEKLIKSEIQIRNFAKYLNNAIEDERSHIAREIHDEFGQQLAGVKIGLGSLKKIIEEEKAEEKIDLLVKDIDVTLQSLRRIATALRPGILDTLGLVPSIEWLVKEFEKKSNLPCHLKVKAKEEKYEKNISTCFFRVCQEALTNISKHARATKVDVNLSFDTGELLLSISDNGRGMTGEKLENPFSTGLLGMRERANIVGAELKIVSEKNIGTTIQLTLKVP